MVWRARFADTSSNPTPAGNCVRKFRAQLLSLAWVLLGSSLAAGSTVYRLNMGAPATDLALPGLQIVVHTVTQTDQDLIMRVGVFNPTDKPVTGDQVLTATNITLTAYAKGKRYQITPTTSTLTDLCPGGSLAGRSMNNGLLTFAWGSHEALVETLGTMTLRLAHFAPVFFSLDRNKVIVPVDLEHTEKRSPLNFDVTPSAEQLAIFPMRLHSFVLREDALEVVLSFHNSSRFPVTWKGKLNGNMGRMITAHGDLLVPQEVSDSLQHRLAPPGKTWAAGEDNVGWIRFPLPNAQSAEQLLFSFPGYPPIRCTYDREQRIWQAAARAKPAGAPTTKVEETLNEERTYADLKRFWEDATGELARHKYATFLQRFRGEALRDQRTSITNWSVLPVTSVRFKVPEFQRVRPDAGGILKGMRVEMHYTLATLPVENVFIAQLECDMRRDENGAWVVNETRYPRLKPFWLLGYTSFGLSEHFIVFHRSLINAHKQALLALAQMERSHDILSRTGLPVKPHYAAFLVAVREDFEKLTEHDPDNYSGVATASYLRREDRVVVINQAMYLNDYRFFNLQRAWGVQDRQVTIQHEMVHLALADITRPWTPPWLVEGVAMHFASQCDAFTRKNLRHAMTPAISLPHLSILSHLGTDTNDATKLMAEYQFSGETVQWLGKKYGENAVLRLYAGYATPIPGNIATLGGNDEAAEAARLDLTRLILTRHFNDLTLDQLDDQVRGMVMD